MSTHAAVRIACISLGVGLAVSAAVGYIHFPPMTLQKMCKESHQIRFLKIEKLNKEKGVIVFEMAQSLKGEKSQITSFKHVIRTDTEGGKADPGLGRGGEGSGDVLYRE